MKHTYIILFLSDPSTFNLLCFLSFSIYNLPIFLSSLFLRFRSSMGMEIDYMSIKSGWSEPSCLLYKVHRQAGTGPVRTLSCFLACLRFSFKENIASFFPLPSLLSPECISPSSQYTHLSLLLVHPPHYQRLNSVSLKCKYCTLKYSILFDPIVFYDTDHRILIVSTSMCTCSQQILILDTIDLSKVFIFKFLLCASISLESALGFIRSGHYRLFII